MTRGRFLSAVRTPDGCRTPVSIKALHLARLTSIPPSANASRNLKNVAATAIHSQNSIPSSAYQTSTHGSLSHLAGARTSRSRAKTIDKTGSPAPRLSLTRASRVFSAVCMGNCTPSSIAVLLGSLPPLTKKHRAPVC